MKPQKKILIAGGTGFIGYHLAKKSLEKGWLVSSISSNPPPQRRKLSNVKYIFCDITKKKSLEKKIDQYFDYVVNLGGYVDHKNKKKTFKSHYIGCKNLAEILLKKKLLAFIQMGSSGEYGQLKSPQNENSRCYPKSTYSRAKYLASKYLINLYIRKKFPVTIIRLYQAYGPKQDFNRLIPIVINACKKNKNFPCSNGRQLRDFVHVNDVVDAIIKSIISKKAKGEIINIGTGKPKEVKKIIITIKKVLKGGNPQFGKIKMRRDEILKIYPSIKKAKNLIKWQPKISFNRGLRSTIRFYNKLSI